MARGAFTAQVKDELAALRPDDGAQRRALLAALLRFSATLHLGGTVGPRATIVVASESGGVARLAYWLLATLYGVQPDIRRRDRGALAPRQRYEISLDARVEHVLSETGLLDRSGGLAPGIAARLVRARQAGVCYVRGAFLARGSVSWPGRPPHLEIGAPDPRTGGDLARLAGRLGVPARAAERAGGEARVVVKGGDAIGRALVMLGAHTAYLAWEDGRIRREVRADAVRLANADQANLERSVRAAVRQVADAERALAGGGLPPALAEVATLRVAHPQASLAELGALLDPPRSRAAVLGRLRRLAALANDAEGR